MSATAAFLTLNQAWSDVLPWVSRQLGDAGLQVKQTFNLQLARQMQKDCPCPHHGTAQCNCQILVLLVYRNVGPPITLTIHGYDANTWVSLVDVPGQRADPFFESSIRRLLTPGIPVQSSLESLSQSQAGN